MVPGYLKLDVSRLEQELTGKFEGAPSVGQCYDRHATALQECGCVDGYTHISGHLECSTLVHHSHGRRRLLPDLGFEANGVKLAESSASSSKAARNNLDFTLASQSH